MVVIKGNRQLTIQDEQLSEMLAKGYSRIDEKGEILEHGAATELKDIKAENDTLKAKLAEYKDNSEKLDQFEALEKENTELKAQAEALNVQIAELSKPKK